MPEDLSVNKELLEVMKKLSETTTQISKNLSRANKETQKLKKSSKEYSDNLHSASSDIEDIADEFSKMSKNVPFKAADVAAYNKKISDAKGQLSKLRRINTSNIKDTQKFKEQYQKVTASINEARGALKSMRSSSSGMVTHMTGGLGEIKSLWGAIASKSPRALKAQATQSAQVGSNLKRMGEAISSSNKGIMKLAGSVMGKLGGAIGGISKALMGWPGLILMGVKAIWDMGMKVDQFKKDINKAYARIRGPDIMTDDIEKQFNDFNSRLYDMGQNLRDGLNVGQVREFLESVYQAGTNIDRLNSSMGDYRSAVYVAAKASKTLSLELPQVGSIISEMINNLRMDMGDIDKAFSEIAFSAQKAGISSDRFYASIQSANSGLAMYGVFLRASTKQLEKFNKLGVMGVEQTGKLVGDLTQQFNQMSTDQRHALVGLVKYTKGGGDILRSAFKEAQKGFADQIEQIEIQMEGKTGEERLKLENKRAALEAKIAMATEAMSQGNLGMAMMLPQISDQAATIIAQLIRAKTGVESLGDLNAAQFRTAEGIFQSLGINTNMLIELKSLSKTSDQRMKNLVGLTKSGKENQDSLVNGLENLNNLMSKDNTSLINKVENLVSSVQEQDTQKIADAQDALKNYFKEIVGQNEIQAQTFAELLSLDSEATNYFKELVKTGKKISEEELQKIYDITRKNGHLDRSVYRKQLSSTQEVNKNQERAEETFEDIRDQTLSYKEMQDIMKDDAKFRAANIKILTGINDLVFGIAKQMEAKSPAQERAEKRYKEIGGLNMAGYSASGVISQHRSKLKDIGGAKGFVSGAKEGLASRSTAWRVEEFIKKLEESAPKSITPGGANKQQFKSAQESIKIAKQYRDKLEELAGSFSRGEIDQDTYEEKKKKLQKSANGLLNQQLKNLDTLAKNEGEKLTLSRDMAGDTSEMVEIEKQLLLGDEQTRKSVASEIATMSKTPEGESEVKEKYKFLTEEEFNKLKEEGKIANQKADLVRPMTVTGASELFRLHRGETISPAPGPGAIGGGGTGRNITINVNATEKDLAQRIANEVRGVMYQQQLTGMA